MRPQAAPAPRAHKVRIIGGQWKRTPLPVPDVEGLRPSPDRVRETLFNWLFPGVAGDRVLDLFAGTGALGFEALSRGAASALLVERDRRACAAIRSLIDKLRAADRARLNEGDALSALDRCMREGERFSLVFLDPPFRQGWLERILPRLQPVLAQQARLYVESEAPMDPQTLASSLGQDCRVDLRKSDKAGQVHYHLFDIELPGRESPS